MMNVAVVGTGYVGLVTGACLAELGHRVVCVDTDPMKIARLRKGEIPIYEPGLSDLVKKNAADGTLAFTTEIAQAVRGGVDVVFIAVGTPSDVIGGAMLGHVFAAAEEAAAAIAADNAARGGAQCFTVFVTKSTVPVGTSRDVAAILGEHIEGDCFAIASNPEFLREGNAVHDFLHPDRIVVGAHSEPARKVLEDLYSPLTRKGHPLVMTGAPETAELIKYAANAFLATKVAFINELARLCEKTGADIAELSLGVGLDGRIGRDFLKAGPGFGGSCFPKDLRALVKTAKDFGSPVAIAETVIRANDVHMRQMVDKIREAVGGPLTGWRFGVLGLAFKAGTDDMRDAPSLTILPALLEEGAEIVAYDPAAEVQARALLPGVAFAADVAAAVAGADAALILTEWNVFRTLSWRRLVPTMRQPLVIDLRNLYEPRDMEERGVTYVSLGRAEAGPALRAAAE